jgi:hypothetical protein
MATVRSVAPYLKGGQIIWHPFPGNAVTGFNSWEYGRSSRGLEEWNRKKSERLGVG